MCHSPALAMKRRRGEAAGADESIVTTRLGMLRIQHHLFACSVSREFKANTALPTDVIREIVSFIVTASSMQSCCPVTCRNKHKHALQYRAMSLPHVRSLYNGFDANPAEFAGLSIKELDRPLPFVSAIAYINCADPNNRPFLQSAIKQCLQPGFGFCTLPRAAILFWPVLSGDSLLVPDTNTAQDVHVPIHTQVFLSMWTALRFLLEKARKLQRSDCEDFHSVLCLYPSPRMGCFQVSTSPVLPMDCVTLWREFNGKTLSQHVIRQSFLYRKSGTRNLAAVATKPVRVWYVEVETKM